MPDKATPSVKPILKFDSAAWKKNISAVPDYAELQVTTNFSFLTGASHPEEYVARAAELGTRAIAITDCNSVAGSVRAHVAAKTYPIQYIVGSRVEIQFDDCVLTVLAYPTSRAAYGRLCRLLTLGKLRVEKDLTYLTIEDYLQYQSGLISIVVPAYSTHDYLREIPIQFEKACNLIKANADQPSNFVYLGIQKTYGNASRSRLNRTLTISKSTGIPVIATNDVHYHLRGRHVVQDVLTCIKSGTTLEKAGFILFQNSERYLKSPTEMARLFKDLPEAVKRTVSVAEACSFFSLDELRYEYPLEIYPKEQTANSYLRELVHLGIKNRFPEGIQNEIQGALDDELRLIGELQYEKYFLTCYDIVKFARSVGILCQGRGAAANSIVCYLLEITSVNPAQVQLLFARFVSKERTEPPDIDIDFEHERREEVIQYIYNKYGREYAGLTAGVVTYRERSSVREVGKVMGLSLEIVDKLAKSMHKWTDCGITDQEFREMGINPTDPTIRATLELSNQILGFPRHLSQHVGGFIICRHPLCETVPILNARMENRTIIEWDKNDIEELGILKIDVLALGMLTAVRKAFDLVNKRLSLKDNDKIALYSVPAEDKKTYDMISRADTIGVFQVESRAQMSMLPRLKPKTFYDLVIQVAIVRPGPIQGNMVHPYLRRRDGLERAVYPDKRAEEVLGKTLGVPIFQEQAMRLAIVCAGFSPGEAEQLRRAMAAWKRNEGVIAAFKERIIGGMTANGYTIEFAETCMMQLKGFAEYGFPESHAASFALITYASCWLKCHFPAEFTCALLNSQPMGFYHPSQLINDAIAHKVRVLPIDLSVSEFDCVLEKENHIRLGLRYVKGINEHQANIAIAERRRLNTNSIQVLWDNAKFKGLKKNTLVVLAKADAFRSFELNSREALWTIQKLPGEPTPIEILTREDDIIPTVLPKQNLREQMFNDYSRTGLSLKAHPMHFVRKFLNSRNVQTAEMLKLIDVNNGKVRVSVAGLAVLRQRPGTAKGVTFITLEDETGITNLMVRPKYFEKFQKEIVMSTAIIASGTLDRVSSDVIYVMTDHLECIDRIVLNQTNVNLPSKTHSY